MFVIDVFEQAFRVVSRSAAVVGNRSEIRDYQIIEGPRCSSVQGNRGDCPGFYGGAQRVKATPAGRAPLDLDPLPRRPKKLSSAAMARERFCLTEGSLFMEVG